MRLQRKLCALCWGLCLVSGVYFMARGQVGAGLTCLGSILLILLPSALEKWWGLEMCRGFSLFCLLYGLGPMLGNAFRLYYLTSWWDKLLHFSGGVVFGVLGTSMAAELNRGQGTTRMLRAVLGLCFSVAVAGVWELFEYGVDACFGTDMQGDTVVYALHSYALGPSPGVLGTIPEIREVTVNGSVLAGYLDIGLVDTMRDMLVETVGAVGYFLWFLHDRDRHPLIRKS